MVKTKSSKNVQETPVSTPVVDVKVNEVVAPAPVPVKKEKKSKKEVVPPSVEGETVVPVTAPVTVSVPAFDSKVTDQVTQSVVESAVPSALLADNSIVLLLSELASLEQQESVIQQKRKVKRRLLEKAVTKLLKSNSKAANKKQKRSGNRQPSGFIRPTLISDELATFLGKESGTEMARTAVTNQINNYIKLNSLKDAKNGRQINADEKLSTLLKLGKDDVLTYFNLQKYMKHHFVKKADAVVDSVAV
jgi:hypothetical protein